MEYMQPFIALLSPTIQETTQLHQKHLPYECLLVAWYAGDQSSTIYNKFVFVSIKNRSSSCSNIPIYTLFAARFRLLP